MSHADEAGAEKYIAIEASHRMLLCRLCRCGIRPGGGVEAHFRHTYRLKGRALQEIKACVAGMELSDPLEAALPPDGSAAIPGLDSVRGYGCRKCRYYTVARDNIARHWRTANHPPTEARLRWKEVLLQSWSRSPFLRYWEVRNSGHQAPCRRHEKEEEEEGTPPNDDDDNSSSSGVSMMERQIRAFEAELERQDAERLRRGDVEEGLDRESAWVKRLGWNRHFGGGRDLVAVYEAAEWVKAVGARERRRWE
ncbi:hypothetical protein CH63R_14417 [Colletotrichum higginsianum IMI 349063]|uniref:C2H2-type domain-containing protein n=1 Tax=Colletotrichum higginsianum (strain IMI 349063) TaxID=759273 RepID=A0A1B7XQS7_COLHI|nr:hypothetical protein CH63R_14417 [Colletotrichum higginsianum IMI 349063]OBR02116.1 hypothetical protein CH63R_14417 [Colletotrichum higginsianum IMI 349063]